MSDRPDEFTRMCDDLAAALAQSGANDAAQEVYGWWHEWLEGFRRDGGLRIFLREMILRKDPDVLSCLASYLSEDECEQLEERGALPPAVIASVMAFFDNASEAVQLNLLEHAMKHLRTQAAPLLQVLMGIMPKLLQYSASVLDVDQCKLHFREVFEHVALCTLLFGGDTITDILIGDDARAVRAFYFFQEWNAWNTYAGTHLHLPSTLE